MKGGCWRCWWGRGGGGGKGQCERWVGKWGEGVGVGCLVERWVDGSGVKFNSQISVALR